MKIFSFVPASRVRECRNQQQQLDVCLGRLLMDVRPLLRDGIPELNIPVLEPMNLDKLAFVQRDGPVNIRARFNGVLVGGFSNFTLEELR